MPRLVFFQPSRCTLEELTQLFDFVWPTLAAMWNLRWQVSGFVEVSPKATHADLYARFVQGSSIHGVGNLRDACIDRSWDDQTRQFAKFLLVDICALYESWISQILHCLKCSDEKLNKGLQFPTATVKGVRAGVCASLDALTCTESSVLRLTFYDLLASSPKNSLANLDNLLRCYRYFKECRNCLVHGSGLAGIKLVRAYNEFLSVATPAKLDVEEVPVHEGVVLGKPIKLHLRGVVGLSDIVLRMVSTIDAELSRSVAAEQYFISQWIALHGRRYTLKTNDSEARSRQIRRLMGKLQLPKPKDTKALDVWLRGQKFVT
jgi:hypothetical protein